MIIELAVLSLVVGLLRKGKLRSLARVPLRFYYLFVLPLVLSAGAHLAIGVADSAAIRAHAGLVNVTQYAVLLAAIGLNLHILEMRAIGLGTLLNFLACAANGGVMPISLKAVEVAGLTDMIRPDRAADFVRHSIMTPDTRLKWLADIIPAPGFALHTPEVASIGDLVIAIGVCVLIQRYMCARLPLTADGSSVE